MSLFACQLADQIGYTPVGPAGFPTAGQELVTPAVQLSPKEPGEPATPPPPTTGPTPNQQLAPTEIILVQTPVTPLNPPAPGAYPKPPQSRSAEIRPTEMRSALTHLSSLIGLRVLDRNENELGLVNDYIVNTCETFLLYMLMEPVPGPTTQPGLRIVIPYEALTVNSGLLDAQARAIQLRLSREQLAEAPVLLPGAQLIPTDWEGSVRDFWSKQVRLGSLQTSCNVPGGPVYKVAYASQLLQAQLYDGRGDLLGTVQEAILAPESGKIGFYILQPARGEGFVMVRLAATNIIEETLSPGAAPNLVLLTDPQMFWEAPRLATLDEADSFMLQGKMLQYWSR